MIQRIYFGTAGVGKSYTVEKEVVCKELGICIKDDSRGKYNIDTDTEPIQVNVDYENCIKTVFHPEYSYRDFMVKLTPMTTTENKVRYEHNEGDFLKALAKAYGNILEATTEKSKNVVLVIDEINRGNSAEIFGKVFQLLDRDDDGWSSYPVNLSNMEFNKLIDLIFGEKIDKQIGEMKTSVTQMLLEEEKRDRAIKELVADALTDDSKIKQIQFLWRLLRNKLIKLPPNFSIVATMNTSDESIYYMDSAFKRRWDWEYIDISNSNNEENKRLAQQKLNIDNWNTFIDNLNDFIKSQAKSIRRVEDKLIGYWFIKYEEGMTIRPIQNKLMFFLWDSVFARDKKPLRELLDMTESELVTFGDFTRKAEQFIEKINNWNKK